MIGRINISRLFNPFKKHDEPEKNLVISEYNLPDISIGELKSYLEGPIFFVEGTFSYKNQKGIKIKAWYDNSKGLHFCEINGKKVRDAKKCREFYQNLYATLQQRRGNV